MARGPRGLRGSARLRCTPRCTRACRPENGEMALSKFHALRPPVAAVRGNAKRRIAAGDLDVTPVDIEQRQVKERLVVEEFGLESHLVIDERLGLGRRRNAWLIAACRACVQHHVRREMVSSRRHPARYSLRVLAWSVEVRGIPVTEYAAGGGGPRLAIAVIAKSTGQVQVACHPPGQIPEYGSI